MEILIKRKYKGDTYTIGDLFVNGRFICNTIEDKVRILNEYEDKVYGETAIPEGIYHVKLTYSPKFKKVLPEILNVQFFKGIRIHAGNSEKDSEGCIIVGENKVKGKVVNSRKTLEKLMNILKNAQDPIILKIF